MLLHFFEKELTWEQTLSNAIPRILTLKAIKQYLCRNINLKVLLKVNKNKPIKCKTLGQFTYTTRVVWRGTLSILFF